MSAYHIRHLGIDALPVVKKGKYYKSISLLKMLDHVRKKNKNKTTTTTKQKQTNKQKTSKTWPHENWDFGIKRKLTIFWSPLWNSSAHKCFITILWKNGLFPHHKSSKEQRYVNILWLVWKSLEPHWSQNVKLFGRRTSIEEYSVIRGSSPQIMKIELVSISATESSFLHSVKVSYWCDIQSMCKSHFRVTAGHCQQW